MPVQIHLFKLFLIVAAYAAAFAMLASLGVFGIVLGTILGTAAAALILIVQTKADVWAVCVAFGQCAFGVGMAYIFMPSVYYTPGMSEGGIALFEWVSASMAAIFGMLFLKWVGYVYEELRENFGDTRASPSSDERDQQESQ
jgi:hypothetical protein